MKCNFLHRRRRSRSHSRSSRRGGGTTGGDHDHDDDVSSTKGILLSTQEALHNLYGEISTIRDGDLTHQCIQTNLADVICGGNQVFPSIHSPFLT